MGKNKYNELTQNTALFAISTFGSKIVIFFLLPLYTSVLSTESYGLADLMNTTAQLLIPILTINVQDAVLRFSLDKKNNKDNVFSFSIIIVACACLLLSIALVILRNLRIFSFDQKYLFFLWGIFLCHGIYNVFAMFLKATDKVKVLAVCGIINTAAIALLNIALLLWFKMGIDGYLIANVSGSAIAILCMFFGGKLYKNIHYSQWDKSLNRAMMLYSLPLIANSIAWWLNKASDRYILTYFCGAALNGIYAVSYKIPTILASVQTVFYNAWSVSAIAHYDPEDKDGFVSRVYQLYFGVSIIACSFIMVLNIPVAHFLYEKDFFSAWHYVPPLLVGTVFNGLALFEGCIFTAVKKTKTISRTTLIGAAINTILNFALIPILGAYGAAYATLIGYFTIWLIRAIKIRQYIKLRYSRFEFVAAIVLIFIQMMVAHYQNLVFVQAIILLLLLVLYYKKIRMATNKIIATVKKFIAANRNKTR
ncbi:MAG: oligosaccharide flippase family protein [Clostridiales bacterium]|nr:oligosaccharide flippase family protein [Clostridiales bacterium]